MPRIVYSSTVARSKRLPSARRWSGIERKTSNSDDAIRQPPIRVVADRFRHFRSPESPTALKVQRTAQPWVSYAAATPGGLFAPLLVLGAQLGLFFGLLFRLAFPNLGIQPEGFAVVGMAAFFTGVVRAPLTGIVLVTEM